MTTQEPSRTDQPTKPHRPPRHVPVAVAGWCLVVAGTGHLSLTVTGLMSPVPDGERATRDAMRSTVVALGGLDRDMWQLFVGFSVVMGLLLAGFGGLLVMTLRHAPGLVDERRTGLLLVLVVLLGSWVTALLLLPPPPIVLLGAAWLAVAFALRCPDRTGRAT